MSTSLLQTIKCSKCGNQVEILAMRDQVSDNYLPSTGPTTQVSISPTLYGSYTTPDVMFPPPSPTREQFIAAMDGEPSRPGVSSYIDPSVTNLPALTSSVGPPLPSVRSIHLAPRPPINLSMFNAQVSSNNESVDMRTGRLSQALLGISATKYEPPERLSEYPIQIGSSRHGLDLISENSQLPLQPKSAQEGHNRSDAKTSQRSYRHGPSSARYDSLTTRSSTQGSSHCLRSFVDGIPPIPLRIPNKASFPRVSTSNLLVSPASQSGRDRTGNEIYFGILPAHTAAGLRVLQRASSSGQVATDQRRKYMTYSPSDMRPSNVNSGSDACRNLSDGTSENASSLNNFARLLGLEIFPADKPEATTSCPSQTRAGSSCGRSMSRLSSLSPYGDSNPFSLGPSVKQLQSQTRQPILEVPLRIQRPMDTVLPFSAAFGHDRPTHSTIGQGKMTPIAEGREETIGLQQPEQQPQQPQLQHHDESQDPCLPRRPTHQSVRRPVPPSLSTIRSKGNCKGCGETITGKAISSSDGRLTGRYHHGCFVCFECHASFPSADFYVLNDRPFCAQHYHERNGSLCSTCHSGIEGQYLETVERDGICPNQRRYHPKCLQSRACHVLLKGRYFEWNGEAYCEEDGKRVGNACYRPLEPRRHPRSLRPLGPGRLRGRRPTIGSSPLAHSTP